MKVRVIKEHPMTERLFPLGMETILTNTYSLEDKVIEGFWTNLPTTELRGKQLISVTRKHWVEGKVIPKGTYLSSNIIGSTGYEYSIDFFYRVSGRSFSEFFEKVE